MDIGLVVEGQHGLTWERWHRVIGLVDELGFASMFRSDHFFIGQQDESLEAFVSFVAAATKTARVRFGALVTPVMFRTPVDVGRMAAQIDVLSGGRFVLGLGAGWYEDEHRRYGIDFPSAGERLDRLEELIQVCRALWRPGPSTFNGRFYGVQDVECRPKPYGGRQIPILLGGVGERRTLKLVAQHADEWCSECISVAEYARKVAVLTEHCDAVGRDPSMIRRSMVIAGDVVPTPRSMVRHARQRSRNALKRGSSQEGFIVPTRTGGLMGGHHQIVSALSAYRELGLQEAVFKHMDLNDDRSIEYLADKVVPLARKL